jgi:Tol biopolymer transport system component
MDDEVQPGVGEGATQTEVASEVVRRHLLRVLSSEAFRGSRRSGLLLETLVEAMLAGRTGDMKEHKLAQQFFPDISGFKSSSFYKMRGVQKRMRARLQSYYRTEGKFDDVVFSFERGLYVPRIAWRSSGAGVELPETPPSEPERVEAAADGEEHEPEPTPVVVRRTRRHSRKSTSGYRWAIAGALVAIPLLAGVGLLLSSKTDVLAPLPEFDKARMVTREGELALDPTLSANGKYLVYASDRETQGNLNIWMATIGSKDVLPRRLTNSDVDETQPAIDSSGSTVVYYSQQGRPGIWAIATNGGSPRMLAEGGRRPRISPDGKLVAYWMSNQGSGDVESSMWVAPLSGGAPKQLAADFSVAEHPTWSPDGKRLLFLGRPKRPNSGGLRQEEAPIQAPDWWVIGLDGRELTRTKALPEGASDILFGPPTSWTPFTNRILADTMQISVRQPVAISLSPAYERMGQTENLTSQGIRNGQPYYAGQRIASVQIDVASQVVALPVDPSTGLASGALEVLTQKGGGNEFSPTLSPDGTKLALVAERMSNFNAYIRDISKRTERRASNLPRGWSPVYSRDGRFLAVLYPMAGRAGTASGAGAIEIHSPSGISQPIPCDRCERLIGISRDGTRVLYMARNPNNPAWIGMVHVPSGRHSTLVGHPNVVFAADWSPDERSIVFSTRLPEAGGQLMLISADGDPSARAAVLVGGEGGDKPAFSHDGRMVYFVSNRDKFLCLWGLRLDSNNRPAGDAVAVQHFHRRRLALESVPATVQRLSVTPSRIALTAQAVESSIWVADSQ